MRVVDRQDGPTSVGEPGHGGAVPLRLVSRGRRGRQDRRRPSTTTRGHKPDLFPHPIFLFLFFLFSQIPAQALTPESLWNAWPTERFVATAAPCFLHAELVAHLDRLVTRARAAGLPIATEELGQSVEGRSIHLLRVGKGPRKVLLWSQMHGDEPSATPALLDLVEYLARHQRDDADASRILDRLTLLIVPMLNPDGAEIYTRRNAQGIDLNRDALNLASPEGRILKDVRDRYEPEMGFNLHDQYRRRVVGTTRVLATNAILAVTGDEARTVTPGRERTMRAGVAVAKALEPYAPGGMARYDDAFSPRAFGDNLTAWGTPVLLIESGGVGPGKSLTELTRLNYVGILYALAELSRNDLADHDVADYGRIAENGDDVWSDVAIRGGSVLQPGAVESYRSDVTFDVLESDRARQECAGEGKNGPWGSRVTELGDARIWGAGREIDGTGRWVTGAFTVGVQGGGARKWLDANALEALARLGVARIVWAVPRGDREPAGEHVEKIAGWGRSEVVVTSDERDLPAVVIARVPREARGATLAERVERLRAVAGKSPRAAVLKTASDEAWLQALWTGIAPSTSAAAAPVGPTRIQTGAPATFFLITAPDEPARVSGARIEAIWIGGAEVTARTAPGGGR
jgi:hypothetical protein